MNTFRSTLRPAAFRGVPFFVDVVDDSFGRRGVHHEFPQRNVGAYEDLGDGDPTFALDAFVIGGDCIEQAKTLIAACREPGSGVLMHPLWGTKTVVCTSPRLRLDFKNGRVAKLTLAFLETGAIAQPVTVDNSRLQTALAADVANTSLISRFGNALDVTGRPGWVAESATDALAGGLSLVSSGAGTVDASAMEPYLDSSLAMVSDVVSVDRASVDAGALVSLASRRILSNGVGALSNPTSLAKTIVGLVRLFSISQGSPSSAYAAQRRLRSYAPTVAASGTTSSRIAQAQSVSAVGDLFRTASLVESARMSAAMDFDTLQDLSATRDSLADGLDAEMLTATDDTVYANLADLRTSVVTDLNARADLPSLAEWTPTSTTPALVAAYEIYDDPTRDEDILARNPAVSHPGLIPGGETLEVIRG